MASCGRNLVQRSSNAVKTLLFRSQSSHSVPAGAPKLSGFAATLPRPSPRPRPRPFFSTTSRLPVELGCGESLMPLHSATASALLNSMLSSKVGRWGYLSEGFATPL
ncbi:protein NUCLEAR FUSION DEFECTIVE 6, mitochondrial-like [Salvia divinorum]|uniref:Protein NUCLEAR FUSION DEFECTIVE 6, mitochondrial-like n=1 Tax=Salvia divinorum TaxID=28513 RepID=A0ABD1G1V7_SALDI